jgi:hypothetical protein
VGISEMWLWGGEEWWVVPVWMYMAGEWPTSAGSRTTGAVSSGRSG